MQWHLPAVLLQRALKAHAAHATRRGLLLPLPQLLLLLSHVQTCLRAVLARIEDPAAQPLVRYRTPRTKAHHPHTPAASNPVHLWYFALAWLRAQLTLQIACTPAAQQHHAAVGGSAPTSLTAELSPKAASQQDAMREAGEAARAESATDAQQAQRVLHAHAAALLATDTRAQRKAGRGGASGAVSDGTTAFSVASSMAAGTAAFDPNRAAEGAKAELEHFVHDAGLTPAAVLAHPAVRAACGPLFLGAEHVAFERVYAALHGALQAASEAGSGSAGALPAVRSAGAALEMLSANKTAFAVHMVLLSEACTGTYTPAGAQPPAESPVFAQELATAKHSVLGRSAVVFVGALARAFPPHMLFDDALACLLDFARSAPPSRLSGGTLAGSTRGGERGSAELGSPSAAGGESSLSERAGATPPTSTGAADADDIGAFVDQRLPPHSAASSGGASARSSYHSPRAAAAAAAAAASAGPEASYADAAWATAASVSAMIAEPVSNRSADDAAAVATHGGWHVAWRVPAPSGADSDSPTASAGSGSSGTGSCDGLWGCAQPPSELHGREEDVAAIAGEFEGGTLMLVVTGVHGAHAGSIVRHSLSCRARARVATGSQPIAATHSMHGVLRKSRFARATVSRTHHLHSLLAFRIWRSVVSVALLMPSLVCCRRRQDRCAVPRRAAPAAEPRLEPLPLPARRGRHAGRARAPPGRAVTRALAA